VLNELNQNRKKKVTWYMVMIVKTHSTVCGFESDVRYASLELLVLSTKITGIAKIYITM